MAEFVGFILLGAGLVGIIAVIRVQSVGGDEENEDDSSDEDFDADDGSFRDRDTHVDVDIKAIDLGASMRHSGITASSGSTEDWRTGAADSIGSLSDIDPALFADEEQRMQQQIQQQPQRVQQVHLGSEHSSRPPDGIGEPEPPYSDFAAKLAERKALKEKQAAEGVAAQLGVNPDLE